MASAIDRLTLVCVCGQTIIVPASAMYRNGLCPDCGAEVHITPENTRTTEDRDRPRVAGSGLLRRQWQASAKSETRADTQHREDAARRFASAVDLYNGKRYAESLTVLDGLLRDFPGDPHIHAARDECLGALHAPRALPYLAEGPEPSEAPGHLTMDLVEAVLLDKLLHGDDAVQVAAAQAAQAFLAEREDRQASEYQAVEEHVRRAVSEAGAGVRDDLASIESHIREAALEAVSTALAALHPERVRWAQDWSDTLRETAEAVVRDVVAKAGTPRKRTAASKKKSKDLSVSAKRTARSRIKKKAKDSKTEEDR